MQKLKIAVWILAMVSLSAVSQIAVSQPLSAVSLSLPAETQPLSAVSLSLPTETQPLSAVSLSLPAETESLPGDVKVKKIWDAAGHSAFTDLIKFKGNYYCSFREGSGHIPGTDGVVRILKSPDAREWKSIAVLSRQGYDLRDPKLSVTPDGRLMVIIGGSVYENKKFLGREPFVSFSNRSGKKFSAPEKAVIDPEIVTKGDWIWRVTWHNGIGYATDYQIGPDGRKEPPAIYLLQTKDGKKFDAVTKLEVGGLPNEATIRFDLSGKMYMMIRREAEDKMGVLAVSAPPYREWTYHKMDIRLGGPNFLFTEDERIVAGTRLYDGKAYTAILMGDKQGNFRKVLELPSGGDNSYPGLILEKERLLVSYYSSHEGKTSIYMAEIPLSVLDTEKINQ